MRRVLEVRRNTPVALWLIASTAALGLVAAGCSDTSDGALRSYAALGDSYASGEGTVESVGECGQSPTAYPSLLADQLGQDQPLDQFEFVACSGAEVPDVQGQISGLNGQRFDLVTISLGGNDGGFLDALLDCIGVDDVVGSVRERDSARAAARGCSFSDEELAERAAELEGELRSTYTTIVDDVLTDDGRLIITDYPQIFESPVDWPSTEGERCDLMARADIETLRRATDRLDDVITAAADGLPRTQVLDQRATFAGHGRCATDPWLNGLKMRPRPLASFHPGEAGHLATAAALDRLLD